MHKIDGIEVTDARWDNDRDMLIAHLTIDDTQLHGYQSNPMSGSPLSVRQRGQIVWHGMRLMYGLDYYNEMVDYLDYLNGRNADNTISAQIAIKIIHPDITIAEWKKDHPIFPLPPKTLMAIYDAYAKAYKALRMIAND